MGRKKIDIQLIKNKRVRKITFYKRKKGLLKKVKQLALLCKAKINVEIIDEDGVQTVYNSDQLIQEDSQLQNNRQKEVNYFEIDSDLYQPSVQLIKSDSLGNKSLSLRSNIQRQQNLNHQHNRYHHIHSSQILNEGRYRPPMPKYEDLPPQYLSILFQSYLQYIHQIRYGALQNKHH